MRRRLLLALVPVIPAALLGGACSRPSVDLGLDMRFPQGLLDQVSGMTLYVFDAKLATCDAATGHVDHIPTGDATLKFALGQKDCPGGDPWCASLELDKDGSTKMFAMVATRASATIAEGCTTAVVNTSPIQVEIQAHRYSPPRCCGNGILEPGEQCDTGVPGSCDGSPATMCSGIKPDNVCFCDCTAQEILLSIDDKELPNLKNGPAQTKRHLALAFGPGGVDTPTVLRAVYENVDNKAVGGADIGERFLAEDLNQIAKPHALSLQLALPLLCNNVTGVGYTREQRAPSIAAASSDYVAVVYQSDEELGAENYDVHLSPQIPEGCTDAKPCQSDAECPTLCDPNTAVCAHSVKLNVTPGGCTNADVAKGPEGTVLVTWTRKSGIFGRIWRTDGTVAPATEIAVAPGGYNARVAGYPGGFRVVYQGKGSGDPDGIYLVDVGVDGQLGTPALVNTVTADLQEQPDIAMLDDGTALVAWHSGGDIFFQRFDAKGVPVSGDQDKPLNTTGAGLMPDQRAPAVAAGSGFFLVAWEAVDATGAGNVAARFVGATGGFGYNSVSGQNDEFIATDLQQVGDRHAPAVALGSYAVVGWEDWSEGHHGVFVRRFPAPTQ